MNKNNILALAGIVPAWIALLASSSKEVITWVVLALVLIVFIWLSFNAMREVIEIRKSKNICDELRVKYEALTQRLDSIFSLSHSHSIFYVWNSFSGIDNDCRIDNAHHQAIHSWVLDITHDSPGLIGFASKMRGFSVAVSESTHLAEKAQRELQCLNDSEKFSELNRKRLKQEWATARDEYNDWLRECIKFFKEVNTKLEGAGCCDYFQFVNTVE